MVLVVGPSGVGKDTLIAGAQKAFRQDERYVFVRRIVTREADVEAEDHDSMGRADFEAAEARGQFALSWQAHGLRYALPLSAATDVVLGRVVVANVSRHSVAPALEKFPRCRVVQINAEIGLRAERLAARGREPRDQIAARLARDVVPLPDAARPIMLDNSGSIANGVASFVLALRTIAAQIEQK
ncbi:ribose 1,5-bisphosphate phosphokinase PhnN [Devosia pacifica]|uniref:Ribose 1,5-bisphosphate phosphokinase PhnN n=2 Tax=Devosia pacifica TaxID=1335967 RepID=A0A918S2I5_9HYPH|nr:ribose 1,5-bisphosphate phosphokinase PhnN [Devosia pacifica]